MAKKSQRQELPLDEFMPFYGKKFYGSPYVLAMKDFQREWYHALLWRSWERGGYVPNDPDSLWLLAGASSKSFFSKHSAIVLERFEVSEDGKRRFNRDLLEIYQQTLDSYHKRREANTNNARSGWEKRKSCDSHTNGSESDAIGCHISISSSNSSSLSSSKDFEVIHETRIPKKDEFTAPEVSRALMERLDVSGDSWWKLATDVVDSCMRSKQLGAMQAVDFLLNEWQAYQSAPIAFHFPVRRFLADGLWSDRKKWSSNSNGKQTAQEAEEAFARGSLNRGREARPDAR